MLRITVLVMVVAINLTVKSQYSREKEYFSHYGMNISLIHSGSGQGYGISVNTNIRKGKKSLEVGAIYHVSEDKIAGADFRYKVFLGQFNDLLYSEKTFKPYFQYNLIYWKANTDTPVTITRGKSKIELPCPDTRIICTIEHYASLGFQLRIYNSLYLDSTLGLGLYIGTVDKNNKPACFGIHKENHGYTYSLKFGLGYTFN